ncbi:CopG family ribbon-helix-helix protein [Nitratidesulfovibrio sp. D1]|uniref:CopG family ribbon-helix-helix protein n=1 Tax=Nitratidesulfovibrio sp. D1 TaxID=3440151 RepID=UPI003EBEF8FE
MADWDTHLDPETKGRLEALARAMGRPVPELMAEAVRRYVRDEEWAVADIAEGVRQADAGLFASNDEVRECFAQWGVDTEPGKNP